MRVVGIDPAYGRTGIATTGDTRSLTPPRAAAGLPPLARESWRRSWYRNALRPLLRGAHLVAVEGMYPTTEYGAVSRAQLLGTIIDLAYAETDAAIVVVAPSSPKILATGNGGAKTDKPAMLAAARDAGSPARNGDEADAWWIAKLAQMVSTGGKVAAAVEALYGLGTLPAHRLRALDPYRPPWDDDHPDPWVRHPGAPDA